MKDYTSTVNIKKVVKTILFCMIFALSFNELASAGDQEGPPDWPQHPNPQPPHR